MPMRRSPPRRSLQAREICFQVTECLSEGSTKCTEKGMCPPCLYVLSSGEYSCYSRDEAGDCPFTDVDAECDDPTSEQRSAPTSSGDSPSTTPRTRGMNTTSEHVESNGATAPERSPSSDAHGSKIAKEKRSDEGLSPAATLPPSVPSASTPSGAPRSNGIGQALTRDESAPSSTGTPMGVQVGLIGGAVLFVVLVLVFVARRKKGKKKQKHKIKRNEDRTVMSRNSQWSERTLDTADTGDNMYSTYGYGNNDPNKEGIVMLSDSQASSTYDPSGSFSRPAADFVNYGGKMPFNASSSQYYSDYGASTGPDAIADGGQHHFGTNGLLPSGPTHAGGNFVDVTASSSNCSRPYHEAGATRVEQHPLTVSQLMPTAGGGIDVAKERAHVSRPKPSRKEVAEAPITSRRPPPFLGVSGVSTASSMRSDYDIVDPITMQDVEARSTEMVAHDHRYPRFSFESETDLCDRSSSEGDESIDVERLHNGVEHMI